MSLLSALHVGANTLVANQIGLSVTGHNIANANTPGYVREELGLSPAPTQRIGGVNIGLGVRVTGIIQKVDEFVAQRLRESKSDVESGAAQEGIYLELETLLSELSDTDLSTLLQDFFSSIHDVVNSPESTSIRNVAILEGNRLTSNIQRFASQVRDIRNRVNDEVVGVVDNINNILTDVAKLNLKILNLEGGQGEFAKAASLRDQRSVRLTELAQLIDATVVEQENGQVNILVNGEFLVSGTIQREVEVVTQIEGYLNSNVVQIKETGGPLRFSSGRLEGLVVARDEILGGFENDLDQLVQSLVFEFNRIYGQGQGLTGFSEVASDHTVTDVNAALDNAGLPFSPENGTLTVFVRNTATGEIREHEIRIELNGLDDDLTVEGLRAALDAIDGIQASLSTDGRLELQSEDDNQEFYFGEDTSGVLASFGINSFFTGTSAFGLGVNEQLLDQPELFAASSNGIGNDVENALLLANFASVSLETADGQSINQVYASLVTKTAQGASTTQAVVQGYRVFSNTLESQHLSVSGVNLDEEAINLLSYQKSYQAAARYIQTINEMLDVLLTI